MITPVLSGLGCPEPEPHPPSPEAVKVNAKASVPASETWLLLAHDDNMSWNQ